MAKELVRAPVGKQVAGGAAAPAGEDIEGKYGAKLYRMSRGLVVDAEWARTRCRAWERD